MKKVELIKIIEEINQKIESVESLQEKLNKVNSLLESTESNLNESRKSIEEIRQLREQANTIKGEVEGFKEVVKEVAETASNYSETTHKQEEEYSSLKERIDSLASTGEELTEAAKNQLGLVSMEVLAKAFFNEAEELRKSVQKWFWWLFGSVIALFIAVIAIVAWQVLQEGKLFTWGFLIRVPLLTPFVYFVIFVAQQHSRDKRLLDEYTFKASVARSFEAYRKLVKEESGVGSEASQEELQKRKLDFVISTIKDIYSSPTEKISKQTKEDQVIGVGILEKIVNMLKNFAK